MDDSLEDGMELGEGEGIGSSSMSITKTSGRVRKKSAKVLEMEEAEKLEKKLFKKDSRQAHGSKRIRTKSGSGSDTAVMPVSPVRTIIGQVGGSPTEGGVEGGAVIHHLVTPAAAPGPGRGEELQAEEKSPQLGHLISKLKMNLGNPSHAGSEDPPKAVILGKKGRMSSTAETDAVEGASAVMEGGEGGLKMKLALSPSGEEAAVVTQTGKTKGKKRKAQSMEDGGAVPAQKVPKSAKKKKVKKDRESLEDVSLPVATSPELLSALSLPVADQQDVSTFTAMEEGDQTPVKKKKSSSKAKKKALKGMAAELPGTQGVLPNSPQDLPQYADTAVMAMRLKTSSEKKASKDKKGKKAGSKEELTKPKKKRAPTAYMLWCNSYRSKVVAENPGIDFAQISKRLGEIWQALPEKEKMGWKRKAKRQAAKAANVLVTGKGVAASKAAAKAAALSAAVAAAAAGQAGKASMRRFGVTPSAAGHGRAVQQVVTAGTGSYSSATDDTFAGNKLTSCNPVDVAAHLKLLGESLSIIGARLQEHQGQIAVQGSLSVLLDSLVCALGPLTCLTTRVPELNVCSAELHSHTLDNIAFIMPGIG